jgi:hypothetical protein
MNSLFAPRICSVDLRANLTCAAENATGRRTKTLQIPQKNTNPGQKMAKTGRFSRKLSVKTAIPRLVSSEPLAQLVRTRKSPVTTVSVSSAAIACSW